MRPARAGEENERKRDRCKARHASGAPVHRLDLLGEVLAYDPALDLERGRQLAMLDGQVAGQDGELLDRLDLAALAVDLVHRGRNLFPDQLVLVKRDAVARFSLL